jgi:hypothetical protein
MKYRCKADIAIKPSEDSGGSEKRKGERKPVIGR